MRSAKLTAGAVAAAALGLAGAALADTMHPVLGAKLSGMGEHGVVNLHSYVSKQQLCWTFELPAAGETGASLRDSAGMVVAHLGRTYKAKGCATVPAKTLGLVEARPASYRIWVDTKSHMGELRGTLFAGMAHMGG